MAYRRYPQLSDIPNSVTNLDNFGTTATVAPEFRNPLITVGNQVQDLRSFAGTSVSVPVANHDKLLLLGVG